MKKRKMNLKISLTFAMLIRFELDEEEESFLKMGSDLQTLKEEGENYDLLIPITSNEELSDLSTLPIQINNM